MGQKPQKTLKEQLKINDKDWSITKYQNNTWIITNNLNHWQAEQHLIVCDPNQSIEHQMQIYHFRKIQEDALVAVYGAEHLHSKQKPLCGNTENIKVVTERIPRRLNNLPTLSLPQALYFLSQSLRGFRACFQKVGYFPINDQMIGVNTDGEVRVWLNQNFALNHPATQRPQLQITSTISLQQSNMSLQKVMIQNILEVIQKKMQQGRFPPSFKKSYKQIQTFVDAYCQIEEYCKDKQIWIPDRLPSNSILTLHSSKSRKKIQSYKSSIIKNREDSDSIISAPHASYIPNMQYCQPIITYVEGFKGSKDDHLRPKTIQVSIPGGRQSQQNRESVKSPLLRASSPISFTFSDKPQQRPITFVAPQNLSMPQSPKINYLNTRSIPYSPRHLN